MANFVEIEFEYKNPNTGFKLNVRIIPSLIPIIEIYSSSSNKKKHLVYLKGNGIDTEYIFKTQQEAQDLYDKLRGKNTDCKHKRTYMGGKYRIQCTNCKKVLISEGQWIEESLVTSILERFKEEASEDNIETKDPSNGAFTKIKYALDNLEGAVQHLLIEEALASLQESKEFPGAERLAKENPPIAKNATESAEKETPSLCTHSAIAYGNRGAMCGICGKFIEEPKYHSGKKFHPEYSQDYFNDRSELPDPTTLQPTTPKTETVHFLEVQLERYTQKLDKIREVVYDELLDEGFNEFAAIKDILENKE